MSSEVRRYRVGLVLSLAATLVSLVGTVIVYRMLWAVGQPTSFAMWFSFVEISQLFLLADFGFTQDFIRSVTRNKEVLAKELPRVRAQLFSAALISSVVLFNAFYEKTVAAGIPFAAMLAIVLSIFLNLLSYAETAALRAKEFFATVYTINIVSSIVFLGVVFLFRSDPIIALGVGTLFRSVLQYILQIIALRQPVRMVFDSYPLPSLRVLAFNAPYMFLFLPDGMLLLEFGIASPLVASILLAKKYFDIFRGFTESALQVGAIRVAKGTKRRTLRSYYLGVGLVHLFSVAGFTVAIAMWVGVYVIDWAVVVPLAFSSLAIAMYRIASTEEFYSTQLAIYRFAVVALIAKAGFIFALSVLPVGAGAAYMLQGALLSLQLVLLRQFGQGSDKQ